MWHVLLSTEPWAEVKPWTAFCNPADGRAGRVDIEGEHAALEKNLGFITLRWCTNAIGAISTNIVRWHTLALLRKRQHVL